MNPARFFWLVAGPSAMHLPVALAVTAFAVYMAAPFPSGFDQVLGITLFLQLFAASTGYRHRLRRGHFDPILTGRAARTTVAFGHWIVSIGAGLLLWTLLGVIDLATRRGHVPTAFTAAAVAVFLYAMTMVWTISLALGRYAGAVLWLVVLFALASTQQLQALRVTFSAAPDHSPELLRSCMPVPVLP